MQKDFSKRNELDRTPIHLEHDYHSQFRLNTKNLIVTLDFKRLTIKAILPYKARHANAGVVIYSVCTCSVV